MINGDYLSYQIVFVLNFLFVFAAMKFASWMTYSQGTRGKFHHFLLLNPFLSLKPKLRHYDHAPFVLFMKFILSLTCLLLFQQFIQKFMLPLSYWEMIYVCPLVYLLTETIGTFGQLVFIKKDIPPLHHHPLKSQSLSEFWGKRWNVWVQDWLRDMSGNRRRSLHQNIAITFLISGFFHEIMFNLPYSIHAKRFFFGNMFLYFLIQAIGLLGEKKLLKSASPFLKRIYLWFFVVVPAPIFMMKSFLLFLGLDNG